MTPPEVPAYQPGPLPPPEEEVRHARAAAVEAITYADRLRVYAIDLRATADRCAAWSRRIAEEQGRDGP